MADVALVVGARPNFIKAEPVLRALRGAGVSTQLVHTGQHYDKNMSEVFFRDLGIAEPDINLEVGSDSHARQTAAIMLAYEEYCLRERPGCSVVFGDVNSTVACSLVAAKLGIKVCHVEAGLRSRDWSMPEEMNRVVTDRLSDLLLTPSPDADENLIAEGVPRERIVRVGNVMIDTLMRLLPRAQASDIHQRFSLEPGGYAVATLHRPSNVDERGVLEGLIATLLSISEELPVVLPLHPRTLKQLERFDLLSTLRDAPGVVLTEPLGYIEFLALTSAAKLVITDSGGLQEETTALGIPCLTVRENTERPITVSEGTNEIVGISPERILASAGRVLTEGPGKRSCPEMWDGHAGPRCANAIAEIIA